MSQIQPRALEKLEDSAKLEESPADPGKLKFLLSTHDPAPGTACSVLDPPA